MIYVSSHRINHKIAGRLGMGIHKYTCENMHTLLYVHITYIYKSPTENKRMIQEKQTSCTATLIAFCQFRGSAVTVRVVTVQPSLPESLWSNSTAVNGGLELWEILEISSNATS